MRYASVAVAVAVAATAILLATTACGGSPDTAATTDQQPAGDGYTQQQDAPDAREFPGAAGEIAAIDGRTLQVQSPMSGQVAVTYTGSTTFTAQVEARASDLEVGDCVMVSGEGDDTVAATSVRITLAVDGSCTPTMRGGPGGGPRVQEGEAPQGMPTDVPTDVPSGAPDGVMMAGAFGKVSAIGASGFTVESTLPGQSDTTTRQVTTSATTTWTDTVQATSAALKVGKCVTAEGTKDDAGAVTAKTIAVSDKVEGQCGSGAARFERVQP